MADGMGGMLGNNVNGVGNTVGEARPGETMGCPPPEGPVAGRGIRMTGSAARKSGADLTISRLYVSTALKGEQTKATAKRADRPGPPFDT